MLETTVGIYIVQNKNVEKNVITFKPFTSQPTEWMYFFFSRTL